MQKENNRFSMKNGSLFKIINKTNTISGLESNLQKFL